MNVVFVEAKSFTRRWPDYLTEDELQEFQHYLLDTPDTGDVIRGTGGIDGNKWAAANVAV